MYTWWAFVRTGVGGAIRVTVQADSVYEAQIMLENQYGDNLQGGVGRLV